MRKRIGTRHLFWRDIPLRYFNQVSLSLPRKVYFVGAVENITMKIIIFGRCIMHDKLKFSNTPNGQLNGMGKMRMGGETIF